MIEQAILYMLVYFQIQSKPRCHHHLKKGLIQTQAYGAQLSFSFYQPDIFKRILNMQRILFMKDMMIKRE
jgi:hypothetical protein